MERFFFERPSYERKSEIIAFLDEFRAAGSDINGSGGLDKIYDGMSFEDALGRCLGMENREYALSVGRCPGVTFLMFREDDGRLVGTINVRWELNEPMRSWGGHVGYGVRPSERRKGYNKINLYFGLGEALKHGVGTVLVGCSKSNVASERSILALGGVFERDTVDPADGEPELMFVIDAASSLEKYRDVYEPRIIRIDAAPV